MILLQYELMRLTRKGVRSVYHTRPRFLLHNSIISVTLHCRKRLKVMGGNPLRVGTSLKIYMARMNEVKPKFVGNSADNFTTPNLEELPIEYQKIYEALKK